MPTEPRCLGVHFPTSRSIGEPLALDAFQSAIGPLLVINPQRDPVVVPEVEFSGVPMKMRLADVEIAAVDAALEDREIIFDGVGMPEVGADIFLGAVVHGTVAGELVADLGVDQCLVGHQIARLIDVGDDDRLEHLRRYMLGMQMEAADLTLAFDERQHGSLGRNVVLSIARLAADVGFVGFDDLILSAERTAIVTDAEIGHCLADAMPEEPRGFHATLEGALKLAGADTFFAGAHQVNRLEPHAQWHVARFHDGAHLDGERLAAGVALAETRAGAFALQSADVFRGCAAVRAYWTIRPEPRFNESVSRFLAVEMCFGKDR
jgi:hypothetical protein